MKIGILGHYGNRNLGDEAIIHAAIDSVRRHFPGADIACFSVNPADTRERHSVDAYPLSRASQQRQAQSGIETQVRSGPLQGAAARRSIVDALKRWRLVRWLYGALRSFAGAVRNIVLEIPFLFRNYRRLRAFDLILVTGSNQFLDNFGGVWGFPYTLLKWVSLARLAGADVALVSLGAGPLNSRFSKAFARLTIRLAQYTSYRDEASRRLVEGDVPEFTGKVFPDLASNLETAGGAAAKRGEGVTTIGINPMPMYDSRYWCDPDAGKYDEYVGKLAEAIVLLQARGYRCFLFNTQEQDKLVIHDILARLDDEGGTSPSATAARLSDTTGELIDVIQSADLCITTRFHGAVLSLRCGVPVIGICYHRKIGDLLTSMEQGEFQLDLDHFSSQELIEKVRRLADTIDVQREAIDRGRADNRRLTEQQYANLASQFRAPAG